MKQLTLRMMSIAALFTLAANVTLAQLPDGSMAPDWTATDINGVEHNLQSYLDQGKTVIMTFHATWCGPCWAYHNTHILWDLYETFGPNGTDDLMVFYMEGDDTTTQADLEGTGTATTGDWITGTPYPIIDNAGSIFDNYAGAYYPTIYTICPDGILTESGQVDFDTHAGIAFADCENTITGPAPLCSYNGATASCGGAAWMASTEMTNLGSDNVTSATFEVTLNGNTDIVNWTGDLASGSSATVELGEYTETGDLNVSLVEVNMMEWAAGEDVTIIGSVESTTYVQVRVTTDNWPEETGWVINDDMGNEIASVAVGSLAGSADTPFTWDVELGGIGCYTFTMYDTYGDGLYASQWGAFADGTAGVYSMDGETEVGIVWEYNGASGIEFSETYVGIEALVISSFEGCTDPAACNYWPVATVDDGSCEYVSCAGCMDPSACNYQPGMTIDDGSCHFECIGCTDPLAANYEPDNTIEDGSCVYFESTCAFLGSEEWLTMESNLFAGPDTLIHEFGVFGSGEMVLNLPQVMAEPSTGSLFGVMSWNNLTWSGLPNGFEMNAAPVSMSAGTQACVTYEGTPFEEGEFMVSVSGELVLSVFGQPYPVGNYTGTYPLRVTPNAQGIPGCTYANATNYTAFATVDDGSCSYSGCTDPEASNYQVYALTEDGSCVFGPFGSDCPGDMDNDGAIGTGDLLGLLGSFGLTCQ